MFCCLLAAHVYVEIHARHDVLLASSTPIVFFSGCVLGVTLWAPGGGGPYVPARAGALDFPSWTLSIDVLSRLFKFNDEHCESLICRLDQTCRYLGLKADEAIRRSPVVFSSREEYWAVISLQKCQGHQDHFTL